MKSLITLADLGCLSVIGEDAATFLQGQITCDVFEIEENKSQTGAFCNPKGKVIAFFVIAKITEGFLLILPKLMLNTIQNLLEHYKLRAKVTISEIENLPLEAFLKPTTLRSPWILPQTSEQFIPQMLNLDASGAVSLKKGCYTGQEIVVRTHYLGDVKRTLNLGLCEPIALIEPNSDILNDENEKVGTVLLAQVRGIPKKAKADSSDGLENTTVNKMLVLCVVNTEAIDDVLHFDNESKDVLKIVGGNKG
jgi:folate-binding protein YgfZ